MRISIFQPDIPQNLGALLRISACLDVPVDIIEPCGFPFSEKKINNANDKDGIDAIQQSIKNYFLGEEVNSKKVEDLYLDYHLIGHQDPYFGTDFESNKNKSQLFS